MGKKTDRSILVFSADVILKQLNAIQAEMNGVRQSEDIECVHRMRVASRRLRNGLSLFETCLPKKKVPEWQRQIKAVTQALGAARDTDVRIELLNKFYDTHTEDKYRRGIGRLRLRLTQYRAGLQQKVIDLTNVLESHGTQGEMTKKLQPLVEHLEQVYLFSPALYEIGFNSITSRLDAFLAYEEYVLKPECIAELHAMRICAKHLRYTLEVFEPLYREDVKNTIQLVRKIQDELGEIHDCDMWMDYLPKLLEKERQRTLKFYGHTEFFYRIIPGFQLFLQDRQDSRNNEYQNFLQFWQVLKENETWRKLRESIQIPFNLFLSQPTGSPVSTQPELPAALP